MLGRAGKESPPGYLMKDGAPEKVKVRVLSKCFFHRKRKHSQGRDCSEEAPPYGDQGKASYA